MRGEARLLERELPVASGQLSLQSLVVFLFLCHRLEMKKEDLLEMFKVRLGLGLGDVQGMVLLVYEFVVWVDCKCVGVGDG